MTMDTNQKQAVFSPSPEKIPMKVVAGKIAGEETETESSGSSEETESPRSVGPWGAASAAAKERVHSQVLRIRDEESCLLGKDKGSRYHRRDHKDRCYLLRHRLNLVVVSRRILPCSPLSGKVTTFKALK